MTVTSELFKGLSIEDASDEEVKAARTQALLDESNPIFAAFKAAFDGSDRSKADWEGPTKRMVVPAANLSKYEGMIRQSAEQLKCGAGVRFRTNDTARKPVEILPFKDGKRVVKAEPKPGEKAPRAEKGKPTACVDEKPYTGEVVLYFWPKYRRAKKPNATATPAPAAPAAPAESAPAAPAEAAKAASAKVAPPATGARGR